MIMQLRVCEPFRPSRSRQPAWIPGLLAALGCSCLVALPAAGTVSFSGLGDLPGGSFDSRPFDVSADGSTVVGYSVSAAGSEPFQWTRAGGIVGLGRPGFAYGASADGSVIVGRVSSASGTEIFRWTEDSGMVGLGDLPGGQFDSQAEAVSADGSVLVGAGFGTQYMPEAVVWESGTLRALDPLRAATWSWASGVSADGETVTGYALYPQYNGVVSFVWTASGGFVHLGDLPGGEINSRAQDISADGQTVVGYATSALGMEAFRWSTQNPRMLSLGDLPGGSVYSYANATSADGSVVVGKSSSSSGAEAFIWDSEHGMRALDDVLTGIGLDLTGWTLTTAEGISDDGRTIVGHGYNPLGRIEGWIAVTPEPSAALLVLTGLAVLAGLRPRRTKSRC